MAENTSEIEESKFEKTFSYFHHLTFDFASSDISILSSGKLYRNFAVRYLKWEIKDESPTQIFHDILSHLLLEDSVNINREMVGSIADILGDSEPFYEIVHLQMMEYLSKILTKKVSISAIEHEIKNLSDYQETRDTPFDLEDALNIWVSKILNISTLDVPDECSKDGIRNIFKFYGLSEILDTFLFPLKFDNSIEVRWLLTIHLALIFKAIKQGFEIRSIFDENIQQNQIDISDDIHPYEQVYLIDGYFEDEKEEAEKRHQLSNEDNSPKCDFLLSTAEQEEPESSCESMKEEQIQLLSHDVKAANSRETENQQEKTLDNFADRLNLNNLIIEEHEIEKEEHDIILHDSRACERNVETKSCSDDEEQMEDIDDFDDVYEAYANSSSTFEEIEEASKESSETEDSNDIQDKHGKLTFSLAETSPETDTQGEDCIKKSIYYFKPLEPKDQEIIEELRMKKLEDLESRRSRTPVIKTADTSKSPEKASYLTKQGNGTLMKNALRALLKGPNQKKTLEAILDQVERNQAEYFLILLKSKESHIYKALYVLDIHDEMKTNKIHGSGPKSIPDEDIEACFKFRTFSRDFQPIPTTGLSMAIHAISIK